MQNERAQSTVTVNGEQAKQELNLLESKAKRLREALIQAGKAAPSPEAEKAYSRLKRELAATDKEIRQLTKSNWDIKKVLDNVSGSSMRDLIKAQKELNTTMNKSDLDRNSDAWKQHANQLKAVKAEIALVNNETKVGQSNFMKFAEWTNQTWQLFAIGAMAITGVITVLKKYMDMKNELEDTTANLKALTGLEDKDINTLTKWAEQMASNPLEGTGIRIRSSVNEIMEAYKLVGSAKPELLTDAAALNEVTKQSMILAAAAGMPLQEAVIGTTTALNQYGASAKEANRYVNALGAGAKFGAVEVPYIAEALTKFGALAKDANVPIEQSIAAIETLGAKGFQAEITGTGLKMMFVKMMAGARDTNPAIVGMNNALDNLNKKFSGPGGFNKMVDMFGEREVVIVRSLIAQREQFKSLSKSVSGTNTAIEQATIASSTHNAKIAQATNQLNILAMQLVNGVSPAVLKVANLTTVFLRILVQLPAWLKENAGLLFTLTGVMTVYTIAVNAGAIAEKARNIQKGISIALEKANTIAQLAGMAIQQLFAGNLRTSTLAMKALNVEMGVNPYVALGLVIAAITVGFYNLATAQTISQKAFSDFRKESAIQVAESDQLFEALKKAKIGTEERRSLIEQINTTYGTYLDNQLTEASNLWEINAAQVKVNESLIKSIALKMKNDAKSEIIKKGIGEQVEIKTDLSDAIVSKKGNALGKTITNEMFRIIADNGTDLKKAYTLATEYLRKNDITFASDNDLVKEYTGSLHLMNNAIAEVETQFAQASPTPKTTLRLTDDYQTQLTVLKNQNNEKLQAKKQDYANGLISEKKYKADLALIEEDYQRWLSAAKGYEVKNLLAKADEQYKIVQEAVKTNKVLGPLRANFDALHDSKNFAKTNRDILEMNQTIKNATANYYKFKQQANDLKNGTPEVKTKPDNSIYGDLEGGKGGKSGISTTYIDPHKADLDRIDREFAEKALVLKTKHLSEKWTEEKYAEDMVTLTKATLIKKRDLYKEDDVLWETNEKAKAKKKKSKSDVWVPKEEYDKKNAKSKGEKKPWLPKEDWIKQQNEKTAQPANDIDATYQQLYITQQKWEDKEFALLSEKLKRKEITQDEFDKLTLENHEKSNDVLIKADAEYEKQKGNNDAKTSKAKIENKRHKAKEWLDYENQILDIDLKKQNDKNTLSLKAEKELFESKKSTLTEAQRVQLTEIEMQLQDETITQDDFNNKKLAIDRTFAEQQWQNALVFQNRIKTLTFNTEAEKTATVLDANTKVELSAKELATEDEKIRRKSVADRKAISKEISELEKKYGIDERNSKHKEYETARAELKTAYQKELLLYEGKEKEKAKITAKYQKNIAKINVKEAEQTTKDISEIANQGASLATKLQEVETMHVENMYAERLKAAKGNADETAKVEAEMEAEKVAVKKKYADIDFAMTTAKIIASTALAIMKALETDGIAGPILAGLVGATGLAEIAVAEEQRQAVQNLWTGGYTEDGGKYEPRGIVHAGEFVANQDAVRNSPMRKVFNLVDYAQKTNTVARITSEDIARSIGVRNGFANGGYTSIPQNITNHNGITPEQLAFAIQAANANNSAVSAELLRQLQNGISANVSVSGKNGIAEKTSIYNQLLSNAQR